jgi:2,4-dienoyl-CoA reductase-like NADH-dependent reductase (Old Yellow Enzyme family)/NADH dehydrogenase FAD-containing subunit
VKVKEKFEKLFSPLRVKNLVLKNRLVYPPMGTGYATIFGAVTPRLIAYHRERAAGGVGLNIVEFSTVEAAGNVNTPMLGIYDDSHIPGLKSLTDAVHEAGGKIAVQISHAGRRARAAINGGLRPWGPSPIPEMGGDFPNAMKQAQIDYIQECFQKAAVRAKKAGFDAVELHTAHGYLIHQFLSPLSNSRADHYGGSLENRARFALETLSRIREGVGEEYPIFCRVSGSDFLEGGSSLAETKLFAKLLERGGADLIDVSAGVPESSERVVPPMAVEHGCNVSMTGEIKRAVNLPVICVGRIKTLEEAEKILQENNADLIAMGRALIADPELIQKTVSGGNIRPCIGCNQGCIDRVYNEMAITCLVNAKTGREVDNPSFAKAPTVKKIAVIGGGPGGLEFARVASARGHEVTLYEREKELGGRFRIASLPPKKNEINDFIEYLIRSVRASNVNIQTGVSIGAENLNALSAFDEVVVAIGGVPICLPLPDTQTNVVHAEDVLQKKVHLGSRVAVIGGGLVGCETAEWIADQGKEVTIIEQLPAIARDMESRTRKLMMKRLAAHKVEILCHTRVECFAGDKVVCCQGGMRFDITGIDNFVLALGYRPHPSIPQLKNKKIHRIGDCVQPRKALDAIHEGFLLGLEI